MTLQSKPNSTYITRFLLTTMLLVVASVSTAAQTPTNKLEPTGNAGVGTTTPDYPLTVQSAPSADPFVQGYFKSTSTSFPYGGIAVDGNSQSHIRFMLGGTLKWQWRVGAGSAVDDLRAYNWTLGADVMTLKNNGNVGIGTTDPANLLTLKGKGHGAGWLGVQRSANTTVQMLFANAEGTGYTAATGTVSPIWTNVIDNSNSNLMLSTVNSGGTGGKIILDAGNVGIGTTSPEFQLDVESSAQWAARFKKTDATHGGILVESAAGYNPNLALSVNGSIKWYMNSNVAQSDSLQFWESTGAYPRFTLTQAGNVGIGTTAPPAEKLEVNGNLKLSGTGNINASGTIEADIIKAKYQDLAEWVPSSEQLAAGTVVVLDTTKSNQVVSATVAYDTRVAGVISAQPGITLGEGGEGKVLVATTGRVRVKVDASRGAIQIGDLLVTSDVPGVAMKSEAVEFAGRKMHMPGTIIGKALEPLAKGSGEILVLLSLQ